MSATDVTAAQMYDYIFSRDFMQHYLNAAIKKSKAHPDTDKFLERLQTALNSVVDDATHHQIMAGLATAMVELSMKLVAQAEGRINHAKETN